MDMLIEAIGHLQDRHLELQFVERAWRLVEEIQGVGPEEP
jgi:hypothetical protein